MTLNYAYCEELERKWEIEQTPTEDQLHDVKDIYDSALEMERQLRFQWSAGLTEETQDDEAQVMKEWAAHHILRLETPGW